MEKIYNEEMYTEKHNFYAERTKVAESSFNKLNILFAIILVFFRGLKVIIAILVFIGIFVLAVEVVVSLMIFGVIQGRIEVFVHRLTVWPVAHPAFDKFHTIYADDIFVFIIWYNFILNFCRTSLNFRLDVR